jgi:hypothetical protein
MKAKFGKASSRIVYSLICIVMTGTLSAIAAAGPESGSACELLSKGELEAVFGANVTRLSGGVVPSKTGSVQMCSARTPAATILLRITSSRGEGTAANAAAEGIKMAREMGAQVDVKTFGAITCSTMIPSKSMEQYGFNTTCSVVKGSNVGAIEVTVKAQKDLVPIDKLRPLAEKLAARMH